MTKVAYITSGKIGIHRFTFNEIELLKKNKVDLILCLTQLNKGPWMPKKEWKYIVASRVKAVYQLFRILFGNPKGWKMLIHAKRRGVIPFFLMALSFYYELKNSKISSIHCQMGDNKLYIGYYLKKLLEIPLSVTVHAHELYQRKVYDDNDSIMELYQACDKVLTISNFNKKIIKDKFRVNGDKIEVMRLFPDIDNLNYVEDKTKILIVANWVEKKGYSVLLKALKELKRNDFVLWVVGGQINSDDSLDVEALVKKYKMEDKVAILGSQSSPIIDIIFYSCDIFCLPSVTDYFDDGNPSEREGIPVALMEAMAWGKPVIATDHAGNSELIKGGLVPEGDDKQLARAIQNLLDHPEEWKRQGSMNLEIVNEKFSKSNIEELISVFNGIRYDA